jgi:hypothetical protein
MNRVTTCGYCGAAVDPEQAYEHIREHLDRAQVVVDVMNLRARLVRHVPEGGSRIAVEEAAPQPPATMLTAAVKRAGGMLNRSGIYPVTPSLMRWIARRAPSWRRIA